jgi:hypothetical protein
MSQFNVTSESNSITISNIAINNGSGSGFVYGLLEELRPTNEAWATRNPSKE